MDFGTVGILQIADERIGVRPIEMYQDYCSAPILKCEVIPNVFEYSNSIAKAKSYLNDYYGVKSVKSDSIKNVIFNNPVTVVIWNDGTKTLVKCQPDDTYSKELGLAMCIAKKFFGNKGSFNEIFKKFIND